MTQEQAIQEAKIKKIQNALAIKSGWSSWEGMWNDYFHDEHKRPFDSKEDESNFKQKIIQVAIEYSSSQLETRDIEISTYRSKLYSTEKELEAKDKEIDKLKGDLKEQILFKNEYKSQLQQATASSSSKDPDAVCERCHKKVYLSYIMREEGLCFCDHPKLPPPSTKRFGLDTDELFAWIEKMRSSPTKTQGELLSLFKKKLQSLSSDHTEGPDPKLKNNPSANCTCEFTDWNECPIHMNKHTEVNEVVTGRNSSVTKSKWSESLKVNAPEPKEGEGREGGFGKWTGNEGNGYDPKSV